MVKVQDSTVIAGSLDEGVSKEANINSAGLNIEDEILLSHHNGSDKPDFSDQDAGTGGSQTAVGGE